MSERVGVLLLALVLVFAAAPAAAAPSAAEKAEARRHFEVGVAKAKLKHYDEAIAEFTRAYDLSPSPTPLYNVAIARAENGQHVQAVEMFQRYLAEGGDMVPADRRAKIQTRIAELEARLGTIRVRVSPETANLLLDGKSVDPAAAARGVRVEPGPHVVIASSDGFVPRKEVPTVGPGAVAEVTVALVPVPSADRPTPPHSAPAEVAAAAPASPAEPAPPALAPAFVARSAVVPPPAIQQSAPPAPERRQASAGRALGYVLAAAGAATLAASGVLYLLAKSDRDKAINAGCTATNCTGQGLTYWNDAKDGVTYSRIAAIAGGALLVGGVTLVIVAPATRDAPIGIAIGSRF